MSKGYICYVSSTCCTDGCVRSMLFFEVVVVGVAHDIVCNMVIVRRNSFSSIIAQGQASAYYFKGVQIGKEN